MEDLEDIGGSFYDGREWRYPWEDVEASRKNQQLQREHALAEAKQRYTRSAKSCPQCGAVADTLAWFYFSSPDLTWETLCGVGGWMTVCDRCHVQVNFFSEEMN